MTFKVGDRVRYRKGEPLMGHHKHGIEYIVEEIKRGCTSPLLVLNCPSRAGVWAYRLELVTSTLDLTKPLQTQDGRQVKIYEQLLSGTIFGRILNKSGGSYLCEWNADGKRPDTSYGGCDLVNVPPPKVRATRWLALKRDGGCIVTADYPQDRAAIAVKEITIEEGEGMEVCVCKGVTPCKCGDIRKGP